MKKSKKIINLAIVFILLLVISLFIILNKVVADSNSYDFLGFLKVVPDYDSIMK